LAKLPVPFVTGIEKPLFFWNRLDVPADFVVVTPPLVVVLVVPVIEKDCVFVLDPGDDAIYETTGWLPGFTTDTNETVHGPLRPKKLQTSAPPATMSSSVSVSGSAA
jgi:hypothetical protein